MQKEEKYWAEEAFKEKTPEQKKEDEEYSIHDKILNKKLYNYADKIAAAAGYEGKISENMLFYILTYLGERVKKDEVIRDRVTEIITDLVTDFMNEYPESKKVKNE